MILWTISDSPPSPFHLLRNLDFKVLKRLVQNSLMCFSVGYLKRFYEERQKQFLSERLILERKFTRIFCYAITLYFFVKCSDDV